MHKIIIDLPSPIRRLYHPKIHINYACFLSAPSAVAQWHSRFLFLHVYDFHLTLRHICSTQQKTRQICLQVLSFTGLLQLVNNLHNFIKFLLKSGLLQLVTCRLVYMDFKIPDQYQCKPVEISRRLSYQRQAQPLW